MKSLALPPPARSVPARFRAWRAGLGALLLASGCESAAKDPPPSGDTPPPAITAPIAPTDRPGPWASDAPPSTPASAEAPLAAAPGREIAGAAHILVAYKGALGAPKTVSRSKDLARKRAEEALQKLRDKKAPFEQLVNEYSDDLSSKPAAGAIGNFERYAMPKAFADATFDLAVGDLSDVVETPRGFHVIRRTK